jgi:chemotaxis protein CheD
MYIAPFHPHGTGRTRVTVMQGLAAVSADPGVVLTAVLGGGVAVCLFDPVARIGGMNHFHLGDPEANCHYGVHMMEKLIDAMIGRGARKSRLRAHIYGGASLYEGGAATSGFAEAFAGQEGITISHRDIGGVGARRLEFLAASGQARSRHVDRAAVPPLRAVPVSVLAAGSGLLNCGRANII